MNLAPGFSRHSTHLLCPSGVGAKFEKAREWGTPVVALGWLAVVAKTGRIPTITPFLVGPGGKEGDGVEKGDVVVNMDVDADLYGKAVGEVNGKGKGKEKAVDNGTATEVQQVGKSMVNGVEGKNSIVISHPAVSI
jgi:DNA replication regulator DPB11